MMRRLQYTGRLAVAVSMGMASAAAGNDRMLSPKDLVGSVRGGSCAVTEDAHGPLLLVASRDDAGEKEKLVKQLSSIGYSGLSASGIGTTEPVFEIELETDALYGITLDFARYDGADQVRVAVYSEFKELLFSRTLPHEELFDRAGSEQGGAVRLPFEVIQDQEGPMYVRVEALECDFALRGITVHRSPMDQAGK